MGGGHIHLDALPHGKMGNARTGHVSYIPTARISSRVGARILKGHKHPRYSIVWKFKGMQLPNFK